MLQNPIDKLDCHTSLKLEETLLTYLADNIGSGTTYSPVCVSLKDMVYTSTTETNGFTISQMAEEQCNDEITATMLEFDVMYVVSEPIVTWNTIKRDRLLEDNYNNGSNNEDDDDDMEQQRLLRKETKAEIKAGVEKKRKKEYDEVMTSMFKAALGKKKKKVKQQDDYDGDGNGKKVTENNNDDNNNDDEKKKNKKKQEKKSDTSSQEVEVDDVTFLAGGTGGKDKGKGKKDKDKDKPDKPDNIARTQVQCTAIQTALCCSQRAINYPSSKKASNQGTIFESGEYCVELGCTLRSCGGGRNSNEIGEYIENEWNKVDDDDNDKWGSSSRGWDDDDDDDGGGWRRRNNRDRARFLKDIVVEGHNSGPSRVLTTSPRSDEKPQYEVDQSTYQYPKKDCPAYSHPKADPTWYDNYTGAHHSEAKIRERNGNNNNNKKHSWGSVTKNRSYNFYTCPAYGILKDKELNEAIKCLTPLDPQETYSQLDTFNLEEASYCSINRYGLQTCDTPILTCDEFYENGCGVQGTRGYEYDTTKAGRNDDLLPPVNDILSSGIVCDDESTFMPTLFPTFTPSLYPTMEPSVSPTTQSPTTRAPTKSPPPPPMTPTPTTPRP